MINRKRIEFFSILFFLFIFLNDHTIYSDFFGSVGSVFLIIATISLAIVCVLSRKMYSNNKMWLILLLWLFSVLIPCLMAGITKLVYVRICYWTASLIALLVLYKNNIDYKEVLLNVVKILCIWCLINYLYTILEFDFLPVTNVSDELLYNWYSVELNGFLIYKNLVSFTFGTLKIIKLYSPLGEPGIACMYFNFAVMYILFFQEKNKRNKIWLFIFSLAIFLSVSLIGIIVYFAILMYYMFYRKQYALIFVFGIISVAIAMVLIIQKIGTLSYTNRTSDFGFMYNTIINNLPFGIGLGNIDSLEKTLTIAYETEGVGFYCGLLYPLAQFGVFGLVYYFMMLKSIKFFSEIKYARNAFALYILLTLLTQPQADECFIVCFLFSGLILYTNKRMRKKYA